MAPFTCQKPDNRSEQRITANEASGAESAVGECAAPQYVSDGRDTSGAARAHWECPFCHGHYVRRKPCTWHMGLVANIPGNCPVVRTQDEARRASRNRSNEE